jgi:hypothetical protein
MVDQSWPELYAASRALLDQGLPDSVPRELSAEHPFIPLGVDIDEDVAVAAFLAAPPDEGPVPSLWKVTFEEYQGEWHRRGAQGGAGIPDYPLRDRGPIASQRLYVRQWLGPDPDGPDSGAHHDMVWLTAVLQASAEVDLLRLGDRELDVPFHGYVAVAARDQRKAVLTAIGRDGSALEALDLGRGARAIYLDQQRRLDGEP